MNKKVLIAFEESQTITIEMRKLGIEAYSCDLLPCSGGHPEWHILDDAFDHLNDGWDLIIAHPPCTYLSHAGNRWINENKFGEKARSRKKLRKEAFEVVMEIAKTNVS
ncbi:MAG: hypothetical protein PHF86_13095, partial [Candidatus Nanoarchaeia archaeon]|nr:hypothetical protein [Candidatus Nanoarchaeia archaeon]